MRIVFLLVVLSLGLAGAAPPPEPPLPTGDLYRYTVERVAVDRVDVYAPSAVEARRMVEAWDRAWPHHREARPLQQTGVAWVGEYYSVQVVAKSGEMVGDDARLDHEEGEGSDAP